MRGYYLTILFTLILIPNSALAALSINEVNWMGDGSSANHEWIELYNNSDTGALVDGWVLEDGLNLSIKLSGTIAPNTYAVLERTSEESAPGPAFIIYTGALVNGGATLTLRDATGSIRDQVAGGESWVNIGGDNVTKETAQYTSSGWVTDVSTPGRVNASGRTEIESVNTDTTINTTSSGSSGSSKNKAASESVNLRNTETKLVLNPNIQSVAYVNQKVPLAVVATGLEDKLQHLVDYQWNFGDGSTATTRLVEHTYLYPGSYVVTVYGKKDKAEQVARREITVLPVNFSMTLNTRGDVQIHNDAPYDVDISGYLLKGLNDFIFSPRTIILPRATITIPASNLGGRMNNFLVALYDPKRVLVTSSYPQYLRGNETITSPNKAEVTPIVIKNPVIASEEFRIGVTRVEAAREVLYEEGEVIVIKAEDDLASEDGASDERWPYLILIVVLLGAVAGIFTSGNKSEDITVTK